MGTHHTPHLMGTHHTPRQHTSSELVYSTISVQRLLDLMVPKFCWLLFRLQASLYSMYGVPVSV